MYIKRTFYEKEIKNALNSVPVVILSGPRQVGKTTLMDNQNFKEKTIRFNGQILETASVFQSYNVLKEFLTKNFDENLDGIILIDEFQYLNNISTILKILVDENKKIKVLCTGSSSLQINKQVDESLAGRVRSIPVNSLSFEEYISFKDNTLFESYLKYDFNTKEEVINPRIKELYNEYLLYGGLPKVALENNNEEKIRLLNDIYQTYLIKDVRNSVETKHIVGFNKMLKLLAEQISSIVSVNELSNASGLKYHTTLEYIYLLEQMYIIKMVLPYATNKRNVISKQKKIYFYDTGIRNIIVSNFNEIDTRNDNGYIFENSVYNELDIYKSIMSGIYFYRKANDTEIDFIIEKGKEIQAIEVKFKTYSKPVVPKIFKFFKKDFNTKSSIVINRNLNTEKDDTKFIQGYLLKYIKV